MRSSVVYILAWDGVWMGSHGLGMDKGGCSIACMHGDHCVLCLLSSRLVFLIIVVVLCFAWAASRLDYLRT